MKPWHLRIGRLYLWPWAGEWEWMPVHIDCPGCKNTYWGPFGVEWEKKR